MKIVSTDMGVDPEDSIFLQFRLEDSLVTIKAGHIDQLTGFANTLEERRLELEEHNSHTETESIEIDGVPAYSFVVWGAYSQKSGGHLVGEPTRIVFFYTDDGRYFEFEFPEDDVIGHRVFESFRFTDSQRDMSI